MGTFFLDIRSIWSIKSDPIYIAGARIVELCVSGEDKSDPCADPSSLASFERLSHVYEILSIRAVAERGAGALGHIHT
jgi:hypothetical protein